MKRLALLTLLVLGASSWFWGETSAAPPRSSLAYVERVLGGAEADARLPLLIALHGLGSSPESYITLLEGLDAKVRVIAPRAPDPWQVGTSWYPIDDRKRAAGVVHKRASELAALIRELRRRRPTRGKAIITGFSQGGVLSFAVAAYHPELLTAALPIAGSLPAELPPFRKAPRALQVIALHGEDDARISYASAERTVARLRAAGTNVSLTGFAGVGHDIPPPMLARYHALLREQIARVAP